MDMSTIGRKIYELRNEKKITQDELARLIGLTPKMISFYERNERTPSRDSITKLSKVLGVTTDYLLGVKNKHERDLNEQIWEAIEMCPEGNGKTWEAINAEELGCKYSNIVKNFIFSQSEIEVDVQIGEEEHNCVADSFVIERKGILFTPQIEGIKKTNGLTILDRSELISLLGKGLIAVEIVLADKERLIINHCYKNKKNWLPSQYYNALPVERLHIETSHKNLSAEHNVRLPCKPGDTVFFIDKKDCWDCEKFNVSCEEFLPNKLCRFELVECEVETLMYIVDKNESIVVINEHYEIYDPASIKMNRADAESLWKHLLTQKCFKCDCTLNKESDKCLWRNDGSCCINMNEKNVKPHK